MYIKNNLSSYVLFSASDNVLSASNKLFSIPSNDNLNWSPLQISQAVDLEASTSRLSAISFGSVSNISSAITATSLVGSYLSDAKSIMEELQSLAEQASDSAVSDEDRTQLNKDASALLDKLDEIYSDASYRGEFIMQGGSKSFGVGPNGAETSISFGNLNRTDLGISSIDLSSISAATSAYNAISDAVEEIEGQADLNTAESESLKSLMDMNFNDNEDTYKSEINQTIFQNSLSVVNTKMAYALNIQAFDLRTNSVNTMLSQFQKLSRSITAAEIIERREVKAEENYSSSSSARSSSASSDATASSTTTGTEKSDKA